MKRGFPVERQHTSCLGMKGGGNARSSSFNQSIDLRWSQSGSGRHAAIQQLRTSARYLKNGCALQYRYASSGEPAPVAEAMRLVRVSPSNSHASLQGACAARLVITHSFGDLSRQQALNKGDALVGDCAFSHVDLLPRGEHSLKAKW